MDKVTTGVIDFYEDRIESASLSATTVPPSIVADGARQCVADRMMRIIPRVFVVDFHEYRRARGLPVDRQSTVAIADYIESFGAETVRRWLDTYPVLDQLLGSVVDLSVAHMREVAHRFDRDRALLEARGWVAPDAAVDRIEPLSSDPHQGGRMVTAVVFDDRTRLIYKPRSLSPELFTKFCFDQVSDAAGVDLRQCAPESLDRRDYGWQREVVQSAAGSEHDVVNYYRRLGAMSAVLGTLGATDMHHENILAAGDHPVAIDLETVMHAERNLASQQISLALISRIKLSLADTLLLPQRMPTGPYSVLMAGIGVAREQQSQRSEYVMVDVDTDAVDLAKRTFDFASTDNVLRRSDGTPTDVLDYEEVFLDGFLDGRAGIAQCRDQIARRVQEKPVRLRHIFRSTATYGRILDAATHPDNLSRPEDFERVIGILSAPPGCDRKAVQQFAMQAERLALARGDVPMFTIDSDELRAHAERMTSPPCADLTPAERATFGMAVAADDASPFELLMIDEGLAELRALRQEHDPTWVPAPGGPFKGCFGTDGPDVEATLAVLDSVSVQVDEVDGRAAGWLIGQFGPGVATFDPGTALSMHDAGGIHVLYERAATYGVVSPERFGQVRRGLNSLVRQYREKLESLPLSVASGLLSLDYVVDHAAPLIGGSSWWASQLSRPEDERAPDDLMRGVAGAGLLLGSCAEAPADVLERIVDQVPEHGPKGVWDLAHGDLGLAWSRHRILRRLGRDDAADAIAEHWKQRLHQVPDGLSRAWCAGYGGLVLVGAELGFPDDTLRSLAQQACEMPPVGKPIDLSVCHGAAGVVQSLVHAAQQTNERWPLELAADYWQRVAKHAQDEGFCTGDPARRSMLGYLLGWSGVADTGLLLREALKGDVVWVPVAFAASEMSS